MPRHRNAAPPDDQRGASLVVGAAAITTAIGAWVAVAARRERKRIRAERLASSRPPLCELRLTRAGLLHDGTPITPAAAVALCTVGVEIVADNDTSLRQRADAALAFERAGRRWMLRWS